MDKEYENHANQTKEEIKNVKDKYDQEFLETAVAFYKEDLKAAMKNDKEKIRSVLEAAADLKPINFTINLKLEICLLMTMNI